MVVAAATCKQQSKYAPARDTAVEIRHQACGLLPRHGWVPPPELPHESRIGYSGNVVSNPKRQLVHSRVVVVGASGQERRIRLPHRHSVTHSSRGGIRHTLHVQRALLDALQPRIDSHTHCIPDVGPLEKGCLLVGLVHGLLAHHLRQREQLLFETKPFRRNHEANLGS